jgi:hypothetical protein
MKKVKVYIVLKDGSGLIAEYKLESNLPFAKSEMKKWIKEQSKEPIESITFLSDKHK